MLRRKPDRMQGCRDYILGALLGVALGLIVLAGLFWIAGNHA